MFLRFGIWRTRRRVRILNSYDTSETYYAMYKHYRVGKFYDGLEVD